MLWTRRHFVKSSAAALGAASLTAGCAPADPESPGPQSRSILILGGTGFIGPHMVRYALSRGHTVTLFNRGRTNPGLFPEVETLIGDRDGGLATLEGGTWDAVIDNSGFFPRVVRDSAALLHGSVGRYVFVSSIAAYKDLEPVGIEEDYDVARMDDPTVEEVTNESYGPLKVLCEEAVQETFGDGATIVRPGYIVGPGDRSDRWTYWPVRTAAGGDMVVPGEPTDPIQFIDARDLAGWMVRLIENDVGGEFNGVGPVDPITMGDMMDTTLAVTGSEATLHWVGSDFLAEQGAFFPIWNPPTGPFGGGHQVSLARAVATGYTSRPIEDTIRDTLDWWNTLDEERVAEMRSGLRAPPDLPFAPASLEVQMTYEAELLAAWQARV